MVVGIMSSADKKFVANATIVLREESDDWALLYDPDSGEAYGLNPLGVIIWKHLDGKHGVADLVGILRRELKAVPGDAGDHVEEFLEALEKKGLASPSDGQVVL
jgi:SynChlorMet cassette protein ScmD